ncbi:MAG: hypothetical protein ACYTEQ_23835 [Planctomycetota bacterium]|jgi:hypothetical protein
MGKKDYYEKPLIEQIYDELFAEIVGHTEFDADLVNALKELAAKGELKKFKEVSETIKAMTGKHGETN